MKRTARRMDSGGSSNDQGSSLGAPGKRTRTEMLRRRAAPRADSGPDDAATRAVVEKGSGSPVDASVRRQVEPHVGADLGGVRVHTDDAAQESATALHARAFTYGSDVFMGHGESPTDVHLMAHELTHVVQQGAAPAGIQRKVEVGGVHDPAEAEADQVADRVVGGTPSQLIVADGATLAAGQMTRERFLAHLHEVVSEAASDVLGPLWSVAGCPYIERWFAQHANAAPAQLEALARRYAGVTSSTAEGFLAPIAARVRLGIVTWSSGGDVSADLAAAGASGAAAAPGPAAAAAPAVQAKAASSPPPADAPAPMVAAALGEGAALDGGAASRIGDAFGDGFGDVRIHTDARAARMADDRNATAFTVGNHIAFNADAYQPGTPHGDALLAHELAHVVQQRGAGPGQVQAQASGESSAHEEDADVAAEGVLARLYGGGARVMRKAIGAIRPALTSGVQLQRCPKDPDKDKEKAKTPVVAPKTPAGPPPLPTPITDKKTLAKGEMKWTLKAESAIRAAVDVEFKPDEKTVDAKNVSFVQTVRNQLGADRVYPGGPMPLGDKSTYSRYEEASEHRRVDHFAKAENDPFYGAEWDATAKKWKRENTTWKVGNSTKGGTSSEAKLTDGPDEPMARTGSGDTIKEFETCAMTLETREALGAIKWGWKAKDAKDSPIELIGGTHADVTDAPSASLESALDKFYDAKFEVILDGFAPGKADLTAGHKAQLDGVVTKMKADTATKVQLGGAADLKEPDGPGVSQKRADATQAYLVSKGIDATKISIEAYGSDWARVKTSAGTDEPKNRRVQVWVRK